MGTIELYDWTFDINVKGLLFTVPKALPPLPAEGGKLRDPALANTISSLPFSCLICAKSRSRSARFATSPRAPITFIAISFTATANSASRRPVMKTYAPSFTNAFAVARPMPLLPPVTSATFPLSLLVYFPP